MSCNKMRDCVFPLIYLCLSKHEFFFGIPLLRKLGSPCLLWASLVYIFGGVLI